MTFLSDPTLLLVFAVAVAAAFFAGRLGRKAYLWLRRRKTPVQAGPPPSRQVQRAERRRMEKKTRD
ncbi:MAG TPA: hypothetical protein VGO34_03940 [Alphaproteobacteria bacterium]|jgi:hypothetical protein